MGNRHRARSRDEGATASASIRSLRLEELIREEVNSLLEGEIHDERLESVRVTRAELSRNGARARLWYTTTSTEQDGDAIDALLQRTIGFFRRELCAALSLKRTPELSFRRDPAHLEESGDGAPPEPARATTPDIGDDS